MKSHIPKITAYLFVLFLLFACDANQPTEDEVFQKIPNINYKKITFQTLERTNPVPLLRLREAIQLSETYKARGANSDNSYLIDSTAVIQMTTGDGSSYFTFAVKPKPEEDFIHNIVVSFTATGENVTTLVEYGLDTTVSEISSQNYKSHIVSTQFIRLNDPIFLQAKDESIDYLDYGFCLKVGYWTMVEKCQGELVTPGDRPDCFERDGRRRMINVFVVIADNCGGGSKTVGPLTPVPPAGPVQPGIIWAGESGTGTNPSPPAITTPVFIDLQLNAFEAALPSTIREWWMFDGDRDAIADFIDYLHGNNYSPESVEVVINSIQEIIDASADLPAHPGVGTPSEEILFYNNIKKELQCLDRNAPATITIYVDQPVPGTDIVNVGDDVGHAFISINQDTVRRVIGFYPTIPVHPLVPVREGGLAYNGGHQFDVKIQLTVTPEKLRKIIAEIEGYPTLYDLNTNNCTDFAIKISKLSGLNVPPAYSNWNGGGGDNPGKFGRNLQLMQLPVGAIRTIGTNLALPNSSACL